MAHFLFVAPSYHPFVGGAQRFQAAMAERLLREGHRVTVLTSMAREAPDFWRPPPRDQPSLPRAEHMGGVDVRRLPLAYPTPAPYAFGVARRVGHWLQRSPLPPQWQRPWLEALARWMPPLPGLSGALAELVPQADLVQLADSSWDGLWLATAQAAGAARRPLVAVPFMHLGDAGVRAHFQMAHQVAIYQGAAAVLVLSPAEADAFAALGVRRARLHHLTMGVEPLAPLPSTPPDLPWTAAPRPLVAFLGATTYDKGAFTLIEAVARLRLAGSPATLVCAGPQREAAQGFLLTLPPELNAALAGGLHLLGIVDEATKQHLLGRCDLLALPSQVDTFGIVLLEAWQHGRPVIGAKAGGIPALIREGENGLLVPFGDVLALGQAIARLADAPAWAAGLGAAGQRMVAERFSWETTYKRLWEVYRPLLG